MRGIRLGSLFGIPIRLGVTFLLVLPLFAWLIGSDVGNLAGLLNRTLAPATTLNAGALVDGSLRWLLGTAAAVGLFVCILFHEFGHSLVAIRYGYGIESITLWLFGGVARFEETPENWRHELLVALAGPVVSVALGAVGYAAFLAVPVGRDPIRFLAGYLALMNVALAAFNMLPGFPMDGGRVLRALLARSRSHARATQIAAEVGKGFAFLLGIAGLFTNLWLIALAFFIYIGASSEAQQTVMKAAFEGVSVADVMTGQRALQTVAPGTSVAELMERMFAERHTGYPVVDDGRLVGMVTLDDAREVRDVERDAYTVAEVMSREVASVTPEADAMDALQRMRSEDVGRLPVIDTNGDLVGIISRTDLMTAFDIIQSTGSTESVQRSRAV
ncbi:MAG: CBS domain-containing protein [Halolamina sp.]